MALRLQIVSRHRKSLGERGIKEFGQNGGTIGRSLESDWVLPDGQRFLSSRHASIDFRSGSYYIIDTSTNGVYINGADQAVGRGNPQRLFSGDRVRIGDYEMLVEIDEIDSTREQLADIPHVDPVDLRQRVEAPEPTGRDLVDAFEVTGVGIEVMLEEDQAATLTPLGYAFDDGGLELEEPAPAPKAAARKRKAPAAPAAGAPVAPAPAPKTPGRVSKAAATAAPKPAAAKASAQKPAEQRPAAPQPAVPVKAAAATQAVPPTARKASPPSAKPAAPKAAQPPTTPAPPTAPAPAAAQTAPKALPPTALDAFFRGAGMQPVSLDERQAEQMLHRLGQVMRETIVGLSENLHLRAAQKTALRQSNTTIQPRDNNALKFSAGVDESLGNLFFRPESEEYLDAIESVREAFGDVKQHQQVLLKALQSAVTDYIARLDPDELEEKFSSRRGGVLLGAANKLKYWDLYKDLYQVVAQQNPNEMPQLFLEELSRAYEAESDRVTSAARPGQRLKVSAG